jgi:hypothetical protein
MERDKEGDGFVRLGREETKEGDTLQEMSADRQFIDDFSGTIEVPLRPERPEGKSRDQLHEESHSPGHTSSP